MRLSGPIAHRVVRTLSELDGREFFPTMATRRQAFPPFVLSSFRPFALSPFRPFALSPFRHSTFPPFQLSTVRLSILPFSLWEERRKRGFPTFETCLLKNWVKHFSPFCLPFRSATGKTSYKNFSCFLVGMTIYCSITQKCERGRLE